jgi:hypothetical protein
MKYLSNRGRSMLCSFWVAADSTHASLDATRRVQIVHGHFSTQFLPFMLGRLTSFPRDASSLQYQAVRSMIIPRICGCEVLLVQGHMLSGRCGVRGGLASPLSLSHFPSVASSIEFIFPRIIQMSIRYVADNRVFSQNALRSLSSWLTNKKNVPELELLYAKLYTYTSIL